MKEICQTLAPAAALATCTAGLGDSGNGFVRVNGQWTGKSHGRFVQASADHLRPGYFTADISSGLSLDRWDVTLFVRNLANNRQVIQQPSIQGVDTAYRLRPRTVGLSTSSTF